MYAPFTDHARKVMQLANQAAQSMWHEYIGTEHILLGLIDQGEGVAVNALKNEGVNLRDLRRDVERLIQPGPVMVGNIELTQTPRVKNVIEFAMEEARALGHAHVGTEHILLALLREQQAVAAQLLMNRGLTLEPLRAEIVRLVGGTPREPATPPGPKNDPPISMYERFTDRARKIMQLANKAAQRGRREYIGTEHILWGLLAERSGVAATTLRNLGVDMPRLLGETERLDENHQDKGSKSIGRAKNVIDWAMREAQQLGHDYVGTEHVLLGLMREQEGQAAQLLMNEGLTLDTVREELTRLIDLGIRSRPVPSMLIARPPRVDEDLPGEIRESIQRINIEIERVWLEKEYAIASQEFEKAAALRDEADKLECRKRAIRNEFAN